MTPSICSTFGWNLAFPRPCLCIAGFTTLRLKVGGPLRVAVTDRNVGGGSDDVGVGVLVTDTWHKLLVLYPPLISGPSTTSIEYVGMLWRWK